MSERRIRWSFAAVAALLGVYAFTHLDLSTDVTHFMPQDSEAELAVLASRLAGSELTRTMILTLGAPELDDAVAAARSLARRMAEHPEVAWIRGETDPEQLEQVYRIYFPRRHLFLSAHPERDIPRLSTPDALRERARELRASLALPTSTLLKRVAASDPLGAFEGIVDRLRAQRPPLDTHRGHFVTRDGEWAVVFLASRSSAFDSLPQARLLADLDAAFAEVAREIPAPLRLEASGSNRFAVAAERSIRRDVHWIAALSLLGVAAIFLTLLRSPSYLFLALLPPVAGILAAASIVRFATGKLDGVTLAFGASLVGVAIDYSIHVLDHFRLEPAASARAIVARLRPSLVLGALTTMASFVGLALTSFPGFREIGLFATIGVGASLGVTLFVLPAFLGGEGERPVPALASRVATALGERLRAFGAHRAALLALPLGCALAALVWLPTLDFDDDLSHLMSLDPELQAEEERVRSRVDWRDSGRVVFAIGDDFEQAIARNDAVAAHLETARRDGLVGDFRSLHALLWSRDLQERNLRALASEPGLGERVEAAFEAEGFRPGALAPFREALTETPPPLGAAELRDSALGELIAPLLVDLGDRAAALTYLRDEREPEALAAGLEEREGVHVFDQRRFMNEIYREFRATTLQQMGVGCVLVIAVLALRYRRWRPALAAFLPSVLVAGALLAGFAAFGVAVNLLHVTSLILVMGMGVDYGIFIVDSAGDRGHQNATLLSLLLSCATTVSVFGALATSEHAALHAIGATTALGVLLSFVLAPVTLLLLRPGAESTRR